MCTHVFSPTLKSYSSFQWGSVVEWFPSIYKAPGSIPSTENNRVNVLKHSFSGLNIHSIHSKPRRDAFVPASQLPPASTSVHPKFFLSRATGRIFSKCKPILLLQCPRTLQWPLLLTHSQSPHVSSLSFLDTNLHPLVHHAAATLTGHKLLLPLSNRYFQLMSVQVSAQWCLGLTVVPTQHPWASSP